MRTSVEAGIRPRLHLEDATRADGVHAALHRGGAGDLRAVRFAPEVQVCDTMGLGLPLMTTSRFRAASRASSRRCGRWACSRKISEFHPHNDTWLVVANCLAAIRGGCAAINGTSLGKGSARATRRWKACCCT
ncbi:MAG: hypothetical protein IPK17_37375 [Chloroflexi bacterium]|uniref:hypothetical protein n=1 Tax=Candidatus Flexifilum breve TaxID=3140694 RepID=UPI0031356A45|nr:hypothetical protein [Chloroflexota bacterium]